MGGSALNDKNKKDSIVVIPARKGSKRLPSKNMLNLDGKPLVSYSIQIAQKIKRASQVIVASDDKEVGLLATEMGALWVPLPEELTTDDATLLPVLQHCLTEYRDHSAISGRADWVILLQPTCPLRNPHLVNDWANIANRKTDIVVSVDRQGYKIGFADGEYFRPGYELFSPKQSVIQKMRENGVFYMFKTSQVIAKEFGPRIIPVDTPTEQSLANIDTMFDLDLAQYLYIRYNYWQFFEDIQTTATGATPEEIGEEDERFPPIHQHQESGWDQGSDPGTSNESEVHSRSGDQPQRGSGDGQDPG